MAKRITELPVAVALAPGDLIPVVDVATGKTKQATVSQVGSGGGGAAPGGSVVTVGPLGSGASYQTSGVNDEVKINQAINAVALVSGGRQAIVRLLAGTYVVAAPVNLVSNVVLEGVGPRESKIEVHADFDRTNRWVVGAAGTLATGTAVNLSANATQGATTITATAGSEFNAVNPLDYLLLVSDAYWEPTSLTTRKRGEYVRVVSKSSPSLTIYGMVRDAYATADSARLYRVSFVENVGVRNLGIRQQAALNTRTGTVPPLVSFQMCRNAVVDGCELCENDGPGITDMHSVGTRIVGTFVHDLTDNQPASRLGYGVLIGGCSENTIVSGNRFDRMRHAIDGGPSSSSFPAGISSHGVPRGVVVEGNTILRCSNTGISTHNDAEGWEIAGNLVENCESCGIGMRGRSCAVVGNKVSFCSGGIHIGSQIYDVASGSASGSSVIGNSISHIKNVTPGSSGTNFGGYGIIVIGTDNVTVQGNAITSCDAAGIRVRKYARRCIFARNTILNANLLNAANISAIEIEANAAGSAATLTYSGGVVTVTGLAGVENYAAGKAIVISGAATAANNGTFTITSVLSATSVTYANASGATDANNGAIGWYIEASTDNVFDGNTAMNTPASDFDRDANGHAKYLVRDAGAAGNARNVYTNNTGIGLETDLLSVTALHHAANNTKDGGVSTAGNRKHSAREYPIDVQTSSGTPTALLTVPTTTGRNYVVKGFIQGVNGTAGAWLYDINALFLNNGGTLTQLVATPVTETHESSSAVTVTCAPNGTSIEIKVVSIGSGVTWTGRIFVSEARY